MNKIKELTLSKIDRLPTGTVLLIHRDGVLLPALVMVLRGVSASSGLPTNIIAGMSWGRLEGLKTHEVLQVWHPESNRTTLLNGRITTDGHVMVYAQDTAKRDKIATLKLQVEELKKTIESLEG
jgi:hypothetical protein